MTQYTELPPIFQEIASKNFNGSVTNNSAGVNKIQEQNASNVISDLAQKYPKWAMADVMKLKRSFNDANSITGDGRTQIIKEELYPIAHDIKGQGATFGYPLMTDVAAYLCERIKSNSGNFDAAQMTFIKKHIDALEYILNEKITGTGGDKGAALMADLAQGA